MLNQEQSAKERRQPSAPRSRKGDYENTCKVCNTVLRGESDHSSRTVCGMTRMNFRQSNGNLRSSPAKGSQLYTKSPRISEIKLLPGFVSTLLLQQAVALASCCVIFKRRLQHECQGMGHSCRLPSLSTQCASLAVANPFRWRVCQKASIHTQHESA